MNKTLNSLTSKYYEEKQRKVRGQRSVQGGHWSYFIQSSKKETSDEMIMEGIKWGGMEHSDGTWELRAWTNNKNNKITAITNTHWSWPNLKCCKELTSTLHTAVYCLNKANQGGSNILILRTRKTGLRVVKRKN